MPNAYTDKNILLFLLNPQAVFEFQDNLEEMFSIEVIRE